MHKKLVLATALLFAIATMAQAESFIIVGNHILAPNTPNQTIEIRVSSDVANIEGMNFIAVIGDGGSTFGGVDNVVPTITADILTGTIWAAYAANAVNVNPGGAFGVGLAAWSITTGSGVLPVPGANALLATLTIDTTGFGPQAWSLNLDSPNAGATDFAGISITITNGFIGTLIPEPSSVSLGLFGALGFGAVVVSRRKMRRRSR